MKPIAGFGDSQDSSGEQLKVYSLIHGSVGGVVAGGTTRCQAERAVVLLDGRITLDGARKLLGCLFQSVAPD